MHKTAKPLRAKKRPDRQNRTGRFPDSVATRSILFSAKEKSAKTLVKTQSKNEAAGEQRFPGRRGVRLTSDKQ